MTTKIVIDYDTCQGHAVCATAAPHIIDLDDVGRPVVITDLVDDENLGEAEAAVRGCPERAISLLRLLR
jgi:ferredoxin